MGSTSPSSLHRAPTSEWPSCAASGWSASGSLARSFPGQFRPRRLGTTLRARTRPPPSPLSDPASGAGLEPGGFLDSGWRPPSQSGGRHAARRSSLRIPGQFSSWSLARFALLLEVDGDPCAHAMFLQRADLQAKRPAEHGLASSGARASRALPVLHTGQLRQAATPLRRERVPKLPTLYEFFIPWSCKVRCLCPSCSGRRMAGRGLERARAE